MAETVRIMCPNLRCRAVLAVPEAARGRMVRCKQCGTSIRIPDKKAPAPNAQAQNADGAGKEKKAA
ncbi:MAG: hypothetical protein J0L61_01050 [Planctomycetes bacterium]|nr:hypothetical protein [Planctomycetota bacterium]